MIQSSSHILLSNERLEAFRRSQNDTLEMMLDCYLWNVALCEKIYPALHFLEVILRNRIHDTLSAVYGQDWLYQPNSPLLQREKQPVAKAILRIQDEKKAVTPGRIVAGLSFGFWVFLFKSKYDVQFWHQNLRAVFPHRPARLRTAAQIHRELLSLLILRNRAFHHKPIWDQANLLAQHAQSLRLIRHISPDAEELLSRVDHFDAFYQLGIGSV